VNVKLHPRRSLAMPNRRGYGDSSSPISRLQSAMPKSVTNIPASIRQRLINLAKERNQPFELLLNRYALERLLYRLSITPHRTRFVLMGAMLSISWIDATFRDTRAL